MGAPSRKGERQASDSALSPEEVDAEPYWPIDVDSETAGDDRRPFARQRDRLLYSDEFERLRSVTQVISPVEGVLCHDRHTHSLRVEQLAMRIAERAIRGAVPRRFKRAPDDQPDADVCGAAALAHDLGHPPFGHVAEEELDQLLRQSFIADPDGYEGNPQSFRIITRLAIHRDGGLGLKLSRRVLRATLKYPWLSKDIPARFGEKRKYAAYAEDALAYEFATQYERRRSIDAAIMDIADSITYSVHDLIDFYRAGLIDMGSLALNAGDVVDDFIRSSQDTSVRRSRTALTNYLGLFYGWPRYDGDYASRARVQLRVSRSITEYVNALELLWDSSEGWACEPRPQMNTRMKFDQWLVRRNVIDSQTLAVTQLGHRRIVQDLFAMFFRAACVGEIRTFPAYFRYNAGLIAEKQVRGVPSELIARELLNRSLQSRGQVEASLRPLARAAGRLAADAIASLSDAQAIALHARATGRPPLDGFAG